MTHEQLILSALKLIVNFEAKEFYESLKGDEIWKLSE